MKAHIYSLDLGISTNVYRVFVAWPTRLARRLGLVRSAVPIELAPIGELGNQHQGGDNTARPTHGIVWRTLAGILKSPRYFWDRLRRRWDTE